jgi:hypothetical protein
MQNIAILYVSIVYHLVFLIFHAFTNIRVLYMFSVLPCWVQTPAAFSITIKKKVIYTSCTCDLPDAGPEEAETCSTL